MELAHRDPAPLQGGQLALGALILAMANFLAVLDTTIANVSVSNIAGSLGTSTSQGTYVITSYAVAEAISVPLTGWLASRFGAVRVFATCFILFGLLSILCGMATSMNMLVLFRVLLGLSGGPLMPLSQTLMLRIFPKEKGHAAIGLWSMTTLVAPILGPILGGSSAISTAGPTSSTSRRPSPWPPASCAGSCCAASSCPPASSLSTRWAWDC